MKFLKLLSIFSILISTLKCSIWNKFFDDKNEGKVLFGYLNKSGIEINLSQYRQTTDFSEELASAQTDKELWGFIDINGMLQIQPIFYRVRQFSEELAPVQVNPTYKSWGYINKKGEIVIESKFYDTHPFKNGIARVTVDFVDRDSGFSTHLHGYIDKTGTVLVQDEEYTTYLESYHFYSDGLLPVYTSNGWGFKNIKGELVIPGKYAQVKSFSEGLAAVAIEVDSSYLTKNIPELVGNLTNEVLGGSNTVLLWGYIDTKGNDIVKPSYLLAQNFSEGFALVNKIKPDPLSSSGFFYINKKGEKQFDTTFEHAYSFSNNLACITTNKDKDGLTKSYFINKLGNPIIQSVNGLEIFSCYPFSDNVAYVSTKEIIQKNPNDFVDFNYYEGFIDSKGNPIFPFTKKENYDFPKKYSDGMALFNKYIKETK